MKARKKRLKPRGRVVGQMTFHWACKNMPKSKNGWFVVKSWESGYNEHNCWDTYLIMRYK